MRKEMKKVLSLVLVGTILTGCAGSAGSKTAGGTDGDKAPAAVEKTEANEEGTEKPYDGVTILLSIKQFHILRQIMYKNIRNFICRKFYLNHIHKICYRLNIHGNACFFFDFLTNFQKNAAKCEIV